ncbi:class I SAM-dependent methyltransferase [Patescibacteria group bacterium]|uniref:Putative methyltransferase n=2 Tax=viral metagenome TaxID=1070528 RepID=A0A6M3J6L4_9ZZZZ|nr:class I SAM-dependent methyltransferase [Patescibacteria group bacterium]
MVDVGCAIGDLVAEWLKRGVDAMGIEGSHAAKPYLMAPEESILFADLRDPLPQLRKFDLCTCFEVAEHIEPEYADIFVKSITGLSDRILISLAPPNQAGTHHVNCRSIGYWMEIFDAFGFKMDGNVRRTIRSELCALRHKPGIRAIYFNVAYFERGLDCSIC